MRRASLALALALAAPSCGLAGGPPPVEAVGTPGRETWGFRAVPGGVFVLSTLPLRVREQVTFTDVSFRMARGDIELLGARLLPLEFRGGAGSGCSRTAWPPRGFPGTIPLDTRLQPGSEAVFLLYFRPKSETALTEAIVFAYRTAEGERRELARSDEDVEILPAGGAAEPCPGSAYVDPA